MNRLIILFLISVIMVGCNLFKQPKFKILIYPDSENKHELFINGKPISDYEFNSGGMYAENYRIYEDNEATVQIKYANVVVDEKSIKSGSYLINLSRNHLVSYDKLAYGRYCSGCTLKTNTNFGVNHMSDKVDILVFGFDEIPPDKIETSAGAADTLRERDFYKLYVR